jgi:hypothetical protein
VLLSQLEKFPRGAFERRDVQAQHDEEAHEAQRIGNRVEMLNLLRLLDCFPAGRHRLIEMAQMLEGEAEVRQRRRARVLAENVGELSVLGAIYG